MTDITGNDFDEFEIAAPNPSALIESLRAFGYDLKTAISDLIDNSISAKASNVWIDVQWAGSKSTICITDDGYGMDRQTLLEAMKLGSQSPVLNRDFDDLGRFGLGLKTASFSQCRRLTVRSMHADSKNESTYCWDLDYVSECQEWRVLKSINNQAEDCLCRLRSLESGTSVLWEVMDRLVSGDDINDQRAQDIFLSRFDDVKLHLSMVFHRFLKGKNSISIYINNRPIEPWDPFLENNLATQRQPLEILDVKDQKVEIIPFILPHHSKLSKDEHINAAGPRGWNSHQGFYIYRNKRLLVSGDWLGLGFQKEEHYKLARILIDIPNNIDEDWALDVRKARAWPPKEIRHDLKRIAKIARQAASEIYRHRGKKISREKSTSDMFVWNKMLKHGKIFYRINRDHPLIRVLLKEHSNNHSQLKTTLRLLEETVPVPLILIENAEKPDSHSLPFEGSPSKEVFEVLREVYEALIKSGLKPKEAIYRLSAMEPFDRYPELIGTFLEQVKHEHNG